MRLHAPGFDSLNHGSLLRERQPSVENRSQYKTSFHKMSSTKRPSTKRPSTKRPFYKTSIDTKRPWIQNVLLYKTSNLQNVHRYKTSMDTKRPSLQNVHRYKTSFTSAGLVPFFVNLHCCLYKLFLYSLVTCSYQLVFSISIFIYIDILYV